MKFLCPNGHEWEISSEQFARDGKNIVECPVCRREPLQDSGAREVKGIGALKLMAATTGAGALTCWALSVGLVQLHEAFRENPLAQLQFHFQNLFVGWIAVTIPGAFIGCLMGLIHWRYACGLQARRPPTALQESVAVASCFITLATVIIFVGDFGLGARIGHMPIAVGWGLFICLWTAVVANSTALMTSGLPVVVSNRRQELDTTRRVVWGSFAGGGAAFVVTNVLSSMSSLFTITADELYTLLVVCFGGGLIGAALGAMFSAVRVLYNKKHPRGEMSLLASTTWAVLLALLYSRA